MMGQPTWQANTQAILRRQQPLALYVLCGALCSNLIAQAACSASPLIRYLLFWVHQLGVLFGQSGKFKAMFADIATADNQPEPMTTLKSLCPTRWTVSQPLRLCLLRMTEFSAAWIKCLVVHPNLQPVPEA